MDAQPDVGKLAQSFTTSFTALAVASHEIALVANLPAFNDGQRLFEAIERLSTSINNLRTDVNTLRTEVNTLRTEVNTLRTDVNSKFDSLELRMRAESAYFSPFSNFIIMTFHSSLNHTARLYNSHISSRDTPLRLLHNQHNMAVEGFPRDSATLMRLSGQTKSYIEKLFHQTNIVTGNALTTLLDAFQLPTDGALDSKKRRLREFVGLMVDA